jgi:hypothetical protein
VTRRIDSGALGAIPDALKLGGGGSQTTELEDELVRQVLDVAQLASYASPATLDNGLFLIQADHSHAGAGALSETVIVYNPSVLVNMSQDVIDNNDIWLHSSHCRVTDASAVTGVAWEMDVSVTTPFISGGAGGKTPFPLTVWNEFVDYGGAEGAVGPRALDFRMPRSADGLLFKSEATGAVSVVGWIIAEIVPPGLRPSAF